MKGGKMWWRYGLRDGSLWHWQSVTELACAGTLWYVEKRYSKGSKPIMLIVAC